jgi:FKBP-type peptidyl-prolyl cis-trans isomerase FkpA
MLKYVIKLRDELNSNFMRLHHTKEHICWPGVFISSKNVLKSVKVLFLNFKKINLPFINKMNRILLLCLLLWMGIAGCGKNVSIEQQAQVQATIDSGIIHKYIADNNLTGVAKEAKKTGEFYIIDTLGTGTGLFTNSTLVTVGYSGSLLGSATPFITTTGFNPSFTLGQVILGWQIGIPYAQKGGTIRLIIPSGYAYGPYPQPEYNLPANAILDFTIKLYDITN